METGTGESRVKSVPSTVCATPTISIPQGLTMNGFNLPLITDAQRKLQTGLNIPLLPTLLRGHGLCSRAMAHGHQHSLSFSAQNTFSPASDSPGNPSAPFCYLPTWYGMICFALFSRTHTPGELSCLTSSCP